MPLNTITHPGEYDLLIYEGDSFRLEVLVREKKGGPPVDLTGLVALSQIRNRPGGKLIVSFTTEIPNPVDGIVVISLTADQTRVLPSKAVWDLELDGGISNRHTILAGKVTVCPDVTLP